MRNKKWIRWLVPLVIVFLVPVLTQDPYYLQIAVSIFIAILLAASLRLLMLTGQISLAHSAFMAIGAYASALFVMRLGISFWIAMPLAGAMAASIAVALGYPILRLRGAYFLLSTFAFCVIVETVFGNFWQSVFRGQDGIVGIPPPEPTSIFISKIPSFYLGLGLMLVSVLIMYRVEKSPFGRSCIAIGQESNLAASLGINVRSHRIKAFAISCFFAGIAGSLYAHYFWVISPIGFSIWQAIYILIYVVIGGTATISGPILGAAVMVILAEAFRNLGLHYEVIAYGIALILAMLFLPQGLASLPERIRMRKQARARKPLEAAAALDGMNEWRR